MRIGLNFFSSGPPPGPSSAPSQFSRHCAGRLCINFLYYKFLQIFMQKNTSPHCLKQVKLHIFQILSKTYTFNKFFFFFFLRIFYLKKLHLWLWIISNSGPLCFERKKYNWLNIFSFFFQMGVYSFRFHSGTSPQFSVSLSKLSKILTFQIITLCLSRHKLSIIKLANSTTVNSTLYDWVLLFKHIFILYSN